MTCECICVTIAIRLTKYNQNIHKLYFMICGNNDQSIAIHLSGRHHACILSAH